MFASSRVDKGGSKFKPVVRTRGTRSSATPSAAEERVSDATSVSLATDGNRPGASNSDGFVSASARAVMGTSHEEEIPLASPSIAAQSQASISALSSGRHEIEASNFTAQSSSLKGQKITRSRPVSVVIPTARSIHRSGDPSGSSTAAPTHSLEVNQHATLAPNEGQTLLSSDPAVLNGERRAFSIIPSRKVAVGGSRSGFPISSRSMPPPALDGTSSSALGPRAEATEVSPHVDAGLSSEPLPVNIQPSNLYSDSPSFMLDPALVNQSAYGPIEGTLEGLQPSIPAVNPIAVEGHVTQSLVYESATQQGQENTSNNANDAGSHERPPSIPDPDSRKRRRVATNRTIVEATSSPSPSDEERSQDNPQSKRKRKQRRTEPNKTGRRNRKSPKDLPADGPEGIAESTIRRSRKRKQTALDLLPSDEVQMDEDGQPLELNPEVVTMADLCLDMGLGRPSTRTEESVSKSSDWKKNQRLIRQKARERQKAKFSINAQEPDPDVGGVDRGNNVHADTSNHDVDDELVEEPAVSAATRRLQNTVMDPQIEASQIPAYSNADDEDDISGLQESRFAAQVRLDENGDIVLDDLSLTVDRHEAARAETAGESYEVVEELERDRFVNSLTWSKKISGSRWNKIETDLFYYYVGMWGTDFEMISHLMPNRTRREIKNKYNSESKKNPGRIELAFNDKIPIDLEELEKATGLDLSGPPPEFPDRIDRTLPPGGDEREHIHIPEMDINGEQSDDQGWSHQEDDSGAISEGALLLRASPAFDDPGQILDSEAIGSIPGIPRAGSTSTSATASARGPSISSAAQKVSAKGKKGKSKKGKRRSIALADDEQIIGTIQ